jgi:queuine/archaeosine tRNA-ribosyltransferase
MDDHELIRRLLGQDEGPTLDFKSEPIRLDTDHHKATFIKDVLCMANTPRPGSAYIVFGVTVSSDRTKQVVGVATHPDDANLQTLIAGKVQPVLSFHYRTATYDGKSLGIVEVFARRGGPFLPSFDYRGMVRPNAVYFRRSSSNQEARAEDLRDIVEWMTTTDQLARTAEGAGSRNTVLPIRGASLRLPCFFPSISSVRTNLTPIEYVRVLSSLKHPLFLISAYDVHRATDQRRKILESSLRGLMRGQITVVLDSGNYESFWHKDKDWKARHFWDCLKTVDYGLAFHFDKREQRQRKRSVQRIINDVESAVLRDQERSSAGTIIPIIHADAADIPEVASGVADRLAPVMIAIAERELGEGIIARAKTISEIRSTLNDRGQYYPIHLLGTGNPLSILVYVLSGADSFDGLEWCQTTVDHGTALLHHFQQREFFGAQSPFCSMPDIPYTQATLAHNLLFYRDWMKKIQNAVDSANLRELAEQYLEKSFLATLPQGLR